MASPKKVIRACFQSGLLSEDETSMGLRMVDDRNLTSHTYYQGVAESIYQRLGDYANLMQKWLRGMEEGVRE